MNGFMAKLTAKPPVSMLAKQLGQAQKKSRLRAGIGISPIFTNF
jgi:hypothetical protein